MKLNDFLAIFAISGVLVAGAANAQIREQQPAEFPPASYKGKQYVDSSGCVFIRAGIDGDVSWVPRVTRNRKTICGFKPSLGATVAAAAPAAAPKAKPVQITLDAAPAAAVPAPPSAVKPRVVAPVVVRQTAVRRVAPPKPPVKAKPVVIAPAPVAAPARVAQSTASACPGASAISQRYLQSSSGVAVRCGPQAAPVVGTGVVRQAPSKVIVTHQKPMRTAAPQYASNVTATTRIAPKHVVQNRVNTQNVTVPHGYKKVWKDGRLNPKRAEQNLQGRSDMLLIWTQTVPRRLIDQNSGRDVTASVPLVYPYTNVAEQRRALGEVTIVQRNGQTVKRIVRHSKAKPAVRKPVYSTRSAPVKANKPAKAAQVAGKRYVQIGTYRSSANAQKAAQQIARMGMPARIGKHRKNGKRYMTVQAGPFNGSHAMQGAMKKLRGAGYRDAFARN
jgi:hypothetical protein